MNTNVPRWQDHTPTSTGSSQSFHEVLPPDPDTFRDTSAHAAFALANFA
jgi:hypothetical protein